ncbi:MAG: DNA polymerase III subunit delta [Ruminococcus sp.]|nr:DNA polymerase III subunit delta [Ruminococcus sp.]
MPRIDPRTLISKVKKDGPDRLYYIYGTDLNRVEKLTKQLIRAVAGEDGELSVNRIQGNQLDLSELEDMIQLFPMMSEYNCVFINDYNCEKPLENMNGRTADTITKGLLAALKNIPPQTVVIFNVTGFEIKVRKGAVADKNKKLADFAEKNGTVCAVDIKTPGEVARDISAGVSARGGMISLAAARELAEMCLYDTLMIGNEIDKLCAYADGSEITSDMLHELVHQQSDVTAYKLASAVAAMDRRVAFEAIDEMNIDNENRGLVLYAITNTFLDLYRASCAKRSGRSIADMTGDFGYTRDFVVWNAFRDCARFTPERLRQCIRILRDTTMQLNSTSADPKTALELAAAKMLTLDDNKNNRA